MYVCLGVIVCEFLSRDSSKEVPPIALIFFMDICICFLKNPIDFGDRLYYMAILV